ncbi:MarR family winged helix-turn-helix transcriptional regulator [Vreelandella olivaria]|uniref:MarR family winged helix-turn-helix transcriptional regulator n=1 Tax=Vreelandella olivaria TaxID=390919 RepID=UPI00201EBADD|nr:MarR family transcriptional regulator [Halomonas olivaria]
MANKSDKFQRDAVAAWAKRCYLAGRAVMDAALRPYDIGSTQWYVLYQLAHHGPTMQRDLLRMLQIERATLSIVVGALVRKGLVEQVPDTIDRRQKRLQMTVAGTKLWGELPDLTFIRSVAFDGIDQAEIATAIKVLQTATGRLDELLRQGTDT